MRDLEADEWEEAVCEKLGHGCSQQEGSKLPSGQKHVLWFRVTRALYINGVRGAQSEIGRADLGQVSRDIIGLGLFQV